MVRVAGVEPASHPWEGYIIAVIRHPRHPIITGSAIPWGGLYRTVMRLIYVLIADVLA